MRAPFFFKLIVTLFFFFFGFDANAIQQTDSLEEWQLLKTKGDKAIVSRDYLDALEYYTKAEILAEKNDWVEESCTNKIDLGRTYNLLSNYGEALNYYQQALQITEKHDELEEKVPHILNGIGNLYWNEKDYDTAMTYFMKAYNIAKEKKSYNEMTPPAINIADIYNEWGKYDEARRYIDEILDKTGSSRYNMLARIEYAESLYREGRIAEAKNMVDAIKDDPELISDGNTYMFALELLSKIYAKQNKLDLAILYANKALENAPILVDKMYLYQQISDLHLSKQNCTAALKYKDSILIIKDSLSSTISRGLFETNKVKLKVQEYQNEVRLNKEKHDAERNLFIVLLCSGVVLFYFIYRGLQNRIVKQKQQRVIAENEKRISDLELQDLKNNIAEKNRNLSAKTLYLSGRNELIEETINALAQLPEVSKSKEVTNYIRTLKGYIKTDSGWDEFIAHFEKVNPEFLKNLQQKHPQLTPQDIRFICYTYMNLGIKEISAILSITTEAGKKRKQRIAKKMGIESDDLHEYILSLSHPAI